MHPQGRSTVFDDQLRAVLPWTSLVLGLVFGGNGVVLIFAMTPETSAGADLHPAVPYVLVVAGLALMTVSFLLRLGYRELGSWSLIGALWAMTFALGLISAPGPTETLIALVLGGTILLSVTFERPRAIGIVTGGAIVHWLVVFAARHVQGLTSNPDPAAVAQFAIGPPVILLLFAAFVDLSLRAVQRSVIERDEAIEALRVARDRAAAASHAKSAFFANMSHELRTPLNAIIGYSEMLREDAEAEGSDTIQDLDRVHAAGNHLLSLVNDVLDMSAIEAGKMELSLESHSVEPILVEAVSSIEPIFRRRRNVFRARYEPGLPEVMVDPVRLRQVVLNLLSNAAKFTTEGSIHLMVRPEQGGVLIEVADTGVGIEEARLEHIFEPFERDENLAKRNQEPSTGLGLAIVRDLVRMMHGIVSVQSQPHVGSRFSVWLPNADDFSGMVARASGSTEQNASRT